MKTLNSDRPAADIVMILLAFTVAIMLVLSTIGIIINKILHPDANLAGAEKAIGTIITSIITALLGFVSGRVTAKTQSKDIDPKQILR